MKTVFMWPCRKSSKKSSETVKVLPDNFVHGRCAAITKCLMWEKKRERKETQMKDRHA
jgi:hypothetical protein